MCKGTTPARVVVFPCCLNAGSAIAWAVRGPRIHASQHRLCKPLHKNPSRPRDRIRDVVHWRLGILLRMQMPVSIGVDMSVLFSLLRFPSHPGCCNTFPRNGTTQKWRPTRTAHRRSSTQPKNSRRTSSKTPNSSRPACPTCFCSQPGRRETSNAHWDSR